MATNRNHRRYKEARARLFKAGRAQDTPCHLCGRPIDWAAYDRDFNANYGPSADHVDAVGTGGNMFGKLLLAHRVCNSRRQDLTIEQYLAKRPEQVQPTATW